MSQLVEDKLITEVNDGAWISQHLELTLMCSTISLSLIYLRQSRIVAILLLEQPFLPVLYWSVGFQLDELCYLQVTAACQMYVCVHSFF